MFDPPTPDLGWPVPPPPEAGRPSLHHDDPVADLIAEAAAYRADLNFLFVLLAAAALLIAWAP
jgi:hypothetical protein